jgi:two-component system nitrogen regulation response regulator GlnG
MAPAQMIEAKDLPPELLGAAPLLSAPPAAAVPVSVVDASSPVAAAATAYEPAPRAVSPEVQAAAPNGALPAGNAWLSDLELEARGLLQAGVPDVWDALTRKFEAQLIHTALEITRGRRIEAAQKLGIGRNTITRKIQELGLDD